MSDLAILFPPPEVVTVMGRAVVIRPVQLRHFEAFGEAATGLITLLADATPLQIYGYAKQSGALRAVLGTCTSLSSWRIRRLPVSVAVELMVHVIRVNSGFFEKALVAIATQLVGRMPPSS